MDLQYVCLVLLVLFASIMKLESNGEKYKQNEKSIRTGFYSAPLLYLLSSTFYPVLNALRCKVCLIPVSSISIDIISRIPIALKSITSRHIHTYVTIFPCTLYVKVSFLAQPRNLAN